MEYAEVKGIEVPDAKQGKASPEKRLDHTYSEPPSVTHRHLEEGLQELDKRQAEQQYDVPIVVLNQQVIIERLKQVSKQLEEHDRRAATEDQVANHDKVIQARLAENRQFIEETVLSLHSEIRKSSLRHRLTVYASSSVLVSTLLLVANLFQETIVIRPQATTLILAASILFWFMARYIPNLPPLPEIHVDD